MKYLRLFNLLAVPVVLIMMLVAAGCSSGSMGGSGGGMAAGGGGTGNLSVNFNLDARKTFVLQQNATSFSVGLFNPQNGQLLAGVSPSNPVTVTLAQATQPVSFTNVPTGLVEVFIQAFNGNNLVGQSTTQVNVVAGNNATTAVVQPVISNAAIAGSYSLTAFATDNAGNRATVTGTLTFDGTTNNQGLGGVTSNNLKVLQNGNTTNLTVQQGQYAYLTKSVPADVILEQSLGLTDGGLAIQLLVNGGNFTSINIAGGMNGGLDDAAFNVGIGASSPQPLTQQGVGMLSIAGSATFNNAVFPPTADTVNYINADGQGLFIDRGSETSDSKGNLPAGSYLQNETGNPVPFQSPGNYTISANSAFTDFEFYSISGFNETIHNSGNVVAGLDVIYSALTTQATNGQGFQASVVNAGSGLGANGPAAPNNASLSGNYIFASLQSVANPGDVAHGFITFDGKGGVTGGSAQSQNISGGTNNATINAGGTYTVKSDGSATATFTTSRNDTITFHGFLNARNNVFVGTFTNTGGQGSPGRGIVFATQ